MAYQKDSILGEDSEICVAEMDMLSISGAGYFSLLIVWSCVGHVVFRSVFVPTFEVLVEGSIDLVVGILDPGSEYINLQAALEKDYNHTDVDELGQQITGADADDMFE